MSVARYPYMMHARTDESVRFGRHQRELTGYAVGFAEVIQAGPSLSIDRENISRLVFAQRI